MSCAFRLQVHDIMSTAYSWTFNKLELCDIAYPYQPNLLPWQALLPSARCWHNRAESQACSAVVLHNLTVSSPHAMNMCTMPKGSSYCHASHNHGHTLIACAFKAKARPWFPWTCVDISYGPRTHEPLVMTSLTQTRLHRAARPKNVRSRV